MSVFIFLLLPPVEAPDDLVGWEYIHARTGYARSSIIVGRAGVKAIPVAANHPKRWRRGDVELWLQARGRKPEEQQPKPRRKRRYLGSHLVDTRAA